MKNLHDRIGSNQNQIADVRNLRGDSSNGWRQLSSAQSNEYPANSWSIHPPTSTTRGIVSRGVETPTDRKKLQQQSNVRLFAVVEFHQAGRGRLGCDVDRVVFPGSWCFTAHLHKRNARFRCRRRVLSKLHYRAAVCTGYIVTAGCICRGALCPVRSQSNGLIALSTQLRNCLQFTISLSSAPRALFGPADQFYE